MMAGIRGKDTKPEIILRRGLHALGLRFRLHAKGLPGKPDMLFPRHRAAIFFHGCFWHGHDCPLFKVPSTRTEFWIAKIDDNRRRDGRSLADLKTAGWRVAVIWECSMRGRGKSTPEVVCAALAEWIHGDSEFLEIAAMDPNVPVP